jgi:hypothetical protein
VDKTVRVWWDYEAKAAPPITYSLHMHQAPIFHVRFNDYGNVPPAQAAHARTILTTHAHAHAHTRYQERGEGYGADRVGLLHALAGGRAQDPTCPSSSHLDLETSHNNQTKKTRFVLLFFLFDAMH